MGAAVVGEREKEERSLPGGERQAGVRGWTAGPHPHLHPQAKGSFPAAGAEPWPSSWAASSAPQEEDSSAGLLGRI